MTNKNTQNINYFSYMVDSILFLIVSSLPFKEAARTSVLSKQWRHIWRSTKNIEFQETFFVNPNERDIFNRANQTNAFFNFAEEWILNYQEPSIQNFVLAFSIPSRFAPRILELIKFALNHNTKGLTLNFSDRDIDEDYQEESHFPLPQEFYNYKGLESLNLDQCSLNVSLVNFHVLKELFLSWIELNDDALNTLLEKSPLLESLTLRRCFNMSEIDVTSSNPKLKTLVVENCRFLQRTVVSVNGPQLRIFKFSGGVGDFSIGNQTCLEEANLDFRWEMEIKTVGDILFDLLEQLSSAAVLTVDTYLLQVLPYPENPESQYISGDLETKHLILNLIVHPIEFRGIKILLKSCPLLEALTIDICSKFFLPSDLSHYARLEERLPKNADMSECFDTNLNKVQVIGFKGSKNELDLVQYLLEVGSSMEKMDIYLFVDDHKEIYRQRAVDKVQNFEKIASKNLVISIH